MLRLEQRIRAETKSEMEKEIKTKGHGRAFSNTRGFLEDSSKESKEKLFWDKCPSFYFFGFFPSA